MYLRVYSTMLPNNLEVSFNTENEHDDVEEAYNEWLTEIQQLMNNNTGGEWRLEHDMCDGDHEWLLNELAPRNTNAIYETLLIAWEAWNVGWSSEQSAMAWHYRSSMSYSGEDTISAISNEEWTLVEGETLEAAYRSLGRVYDEDCPDHLEEFVDWKSYGEEVASGHVTKHGTIYAFVDNS